MNRIKKLITSYVFLRVEEISPFARLVVNSMATTTYIPGADERAKPLREAVDALDEFTKTHTQMTPLLTSELKTLRDAVLEQLSKLATGLNSEYAGNETVLLSSGFELAADPQPTQPPGPAGLCEILDGKQSGTMVGRVKRAPGTVNVLWYYTTDPTLPLSKWSCELCNADELTIPNLTPGTRLYLRVACLNGASTTANLVYVDAKPCYVE